MIDQERDDLLKSQLDPEKVKVIEKLGLHADEHQVWVSIRENSFPNRFAKHSFMQKTDVLGIVFRSYSLCAAKLKYYRDNWAKYDAYFYDIDEGFCPTEIWNMEFLRHKPSGKFIDLRQLGGITDIEVFRQLCKRLEQLESDRRADQPDD